MSSQSLYNKTRDLPSVALVITFFTTLFTKKKLNFWKNAPFHKLYNKIVKNCNNGLRLMVKMPLDVLYVWDYISK